MPKRKNPNAAPVVLTGEKAGHGTTSVPQFGDTSARIGTYNPERLTQGVFAKMCRHYQIRVGLALIYLPLLKASWGVEGADPEVCEFVKAALSPVWRDLIKSCARTGVSRGCAPHELVWDHVDGISLVDPESGLDVTRDGWVLLKVKDIDPASITSIKVDGLENFAGYDLTVPSSGVLETEKCFHFTNELEFGNWWGTSRLVGAYDPWYRHHVLWDQGMRYMERRGTPVTQVRYPVGQDAEGHENSATAAAMAQGIVTSDTALWLPQSPTGEPGWDVSYLQDTSRSQDFLNMLNAHGSWMLRSLLIPDLLVSQDGATGSRALGDTHYDMYALGEDGLLLDIIDQVNQQILPRIIAYNFPQGTPVPRITSPGLDQSTKQLLGEVFKLAMTNGLASMVAVGKIADAIGIPTDDETAAPSAPGDAAQMSDALSEVREITRLSRLMLAVRDV